MTAMTDEEIVALYASIVSPEAAKKFDKSEGWLTRYDGALAEQEKGRRYIRSVRNKLGRFADGLEKKSVLDIGCGFGLTCTTIAALGAKEVHGIDNFQPMADTFKAYAPTLPIGDRLHPAQGPADQLPYETGKFDIVLTVEALSHIANTKGYMIEAHRVLKPGGVLLIADDNNAANPSVVQRNREIWEAFENGPPTADIHGHAVRVPYIQSRERIIREAFPSLTDDEVQELSLNTAYMTEDEILEAVKCYVEDQTLPHSRYTPERCPIQPETGHTMEALLDPYGLKAQLDGLGFSARVKPYFFGESKGGLAYQANQMLTSLMTNALLFRYCEGLRIIAVKT